MADLQMAAGIVREVLRLRIRSRRIVWAIHRVCNKTVFLFVFSRWLSLVEWREEWVLVEGALGFLLWSAEPR